MVPPDAATAQPLSLSIPQADLASSRPKLSINTSFSTLQARTFGKGTSLRLDTLSAISPTVKNTYSNAYERLSTPMNPRPSLSLNTTPVADDSKPSPVRHSSTSSASSSSSFSFDSTIPPYTIPAHSRSILLNGPVPRPVRRRMSVQKPLFPAQKKVSFRSPLDEEIKTSKYTLAHSDIESTHMDVLSTSSSTESLETVSSVDSLPTPDDTTAEPLQLINAEAPPMCQFDFRVAGPPLITTSPPSPRFDRPKRPSLLSLASSPRPIRHKRDSSSDSESSDSSLAHTPVAGRSKRQRWIWTLGPLPGHADSEALDTPTWSPGGSVDGGSLLSSPAADDDAENPGLSQIPL